MRFFVLLILSLLFSCSSKQSADVEVTKRTPPAKPVPAKIEPIQQRAPLKPVAKVPEQTKAQIAASIRHLGPERATEDLIWHGDLDGDGLLEAAVIFNVEEETPDISITSNSVTAVFAGRRDGQWRTLWSADATSYHGVASASFQMGQPIPRKNPSFTVSIRSDFRDVEDQHTYRVQLVAPNTVLESKRIESRVGATLEHLKVVPNDDKPVFGLLNESVKGFDIQRGGTIRHPKIQVDDDTIEALSWRDKTGHNALIVAQSTPSNDKSCADCQSAEINVYHYRIFKREAKLVRRLHDFIKACPFDLSIGFDEKASRITDLDKDQIAEITLIYKYSCRSDISPQEMKLILLENGTKYALRGTTLDYTLFELPADQWHSENAKAYRSQYRLSKNLKQAPQVFVRFMKERWKRFEYKDLAIALPGSLTKEDVLSRLNE